MATSMDVKIREDDDETFEPTDIHCKICLKNKSKYTCPRCNLAYCCVSCYKDEKHAGCSEAFYKDCVISELQDMTNSESDKKKVMEMLTRDLEERADEDGVPDEEDEQQSLAERLEGLDLDRDVSAVWGQLSSNEREEFARMMQDGQLARLIELWTPWWRRKKNISLIKENSDKSEKEGSSTSAVPEILADIPDINSLLKNGRPSSDCRFDVVNILFAYAFVSRIHNGDHLECPVDSSQLLLDTSVVLGGQGRCGSVGEAIQHSLDAVNKTCRKEEKSPDSILSQFSLTVLEDIRVVISGPGTSCHSLGFMVAAVSDLVSLLRKSLSIVKNELKGKKKNVDGDGGGIHGLKSGLFKAEKKGVFFLCWLQRYGMGMHQLLPLLQLEIERRQSDAKEVEELKDCVEKSMDHLRPQPQSKSTSTTIEKGNKIVEI